MATAAARTRKRELGPDWRDALRASIRRFAVRSWGALLVGVSVAGALALATHSPIDPSFTTAAGGPPTNWLGSFGAYSSDAVLLLFGLGSALFIPVVAIAGLRMLRLEPSGRIGRGLLIAALGAILIGIALSLSSGSAVSGLPSGWGGALGLAAAHGVDSGVGLIGNPSVAGPVRLALLLLFAVAGMTLGYLALGLLPEEKGWLSGLLRRDPRVKSAAPRRATELREDKAPAAAPPRSRPAVAVTEPSKGVASAARTAGGRRSNLNQPGLRWATITCCPCWTCWRRRQPMGAHRSTAPGWSATRACSSRCSRISTSAATSSRFAPGPWSPCTSSSRRAG